MLPETGKISMKDVNVELKKSETSKISLNDIDVRNLAKINSGKISLNDLHGKSSYVHKTIEILNVNYSDFGVDISTYYPLVFPNKNFINGVVKVKELKNLGERWFSTCELVDKNYKLISDFENEYNSHDDVVQRFIYKISDNKNNPLVGSMLSVDQTGSEYEPSWDPDMSGSIIDLRVGIKVIITLEADFEQ